MATISKSPWTVTALLRECMALLRDPATVVRSRPLNPQVNSAKSEWSKLHRRIIIDTSQYGYVTMILHELLHMILSETVEPIFDEKIEEATIGGIERALYDHVAASPYLMKRWRTEIARKVHRK